jgi:hypothetical protein
MGGLILGIDPGHEHSAAVLVRPDYTIEHAEKMHNVELLNALREGVPRADTVAIECLQSYGMSVGREVFETAYWIGRFWQVCEDKGITVYLYPRPKITRALIGTSGGDAALRAALLQRFGGDKKGEPLNCLKGDGSDKRSAYAVAVYHLDGAKLGAW